jgi:hypothetical protein
MKAIIEIVDGNQATYDSKDHKWHSDSKALEVFLEAIMRSLPHAYYPHRVEGIARAVVAKVTGSKLVYVDKATEVDHPPGTIF